MELEEALRKAFPHGHPKYVELTLEELTLFDVKNHDFAFKIFDAYGSIASTSPSGDLSEALDKTLSFSTGGSAN